MPKVSPNFWLGLLCSALLKQCASLRGVLRQTVKRQRCRHTPSLYSAHLRSSADSGQAREYKGLTAVARWALHSVRKPGYRSRRRLLSSFFFAFSQSAENNSDRSAAFSPILCLLRHGSRLEVKWRENKHSPPPTASQPSYRLIDRRRD